MSVTSHNALHHAMSSPTNTLDEIDAKYLKTSIYAIQCLLTGDVYVGSTLLRLEERIAKHIKQRDCSAIQILDRDHYRAYIIQHLPCNTKREKLKAEGQWQRAYLQCPGTFLVNQHIEGAFVYASPEAAATYHKQYKETHKD